MAQGLYIAFLVTLMLILPLMSVARWSSLLVILAKLMFGSDPIFMPFLTLGLLVSLPIAIICFHGKNFLTQARSQSPRTFIPSFLFAVLVLLWLFHLGSVQPQQQAFSILATPPANTQEIKERLTLSPVIREGLVNAFLAEYRYFNQHFEVFVFVLLTDF